MPRSLLEPIARYCIGAIALAATGCVSVGPHHTAEQGAVIHDLSDGTRCALVRQTDTVVDIAISKARGELQSQGQYWVGVYDKQRRTGLYTTVDLGSAAACARARKASTSAGGELYVFADPAGAWLEYVRRLGTAAALIDYGWLHEVVPMGQGDMLSLKIVEPVRVAAEAGGDGSLILRNPTRQMKSALNESAAHQPALLSDIAEAHSISHFITTGPGQGDINARRQEMQLRLANWERALGIPISPGSAVCSFTQNQFGLAQQVDGNFFVEVQGRVPMTLARNGSLVDVGPGVLYSNVSVTLPVLKEQERVEATSEYFRPCPASMAPVR